MTPTERFENMRKLPEEILFDSRLVERHIRQGLTSRKDYEEWLAKQPDVSDRAEVLNVEGEPIAADSDTGAESAPTEPLS